MRLYIFACEYLRNIQIGHDNKLWAVSALDDATSRQRWGKAKNIRKYSRGLIYSSTDKTFTMPFVTTGNPEDRLVRDVWAETWEFPFEIHPLGSPSRLISLEAAKHSWPILAARRNPTHSVNGMNGRTVFVANEIQVSDWQTILSDLATKEDTFPPEEKTERERLLESL